MEFGFIVISLLFDDRIMEWEMDNRAGIVVWNINHHGYSKPAANYPAVDDKFTIERS